MFVVCIEVYSLETETWLKTTWGPHEISSHKSLKAAGRVLGSYISGKYRKWYREPGKGLRLYAFDTETGERYSRHGCNTGIPLQSK